MASVLYLSYVGVILSIFIVLYHHLTRNFNYWKKQNVPYVQPTFLFGNIFPICALKSSIGELVYNFHKSTTAKFIGFFVFDQPFLLIRDPELIKRVLVKDFDSFSDRSIMENKKDDHIGSKMLFIIKNPAWRNIRVKLTPALASGKIKNMVPLMVNVSEDMVNYIKDQNSKNVPVSAYDIAMTYTTDLITSYAFGIAANSFKNENAEFRRASRRIFEFNYLRGIQFISLFFAPMLVKMFRMKYVDPPSGDFMQKACLEVMKYREKKQDRRGDLIDVLIQIKNKQASAEEKKENDPIFDDDFLAAQAIQYFIAGYETTGSTIFFSLMELSLDPYIQERLYQDVSKVYEKHGTLSPEAIQEMEYLDMVVSETLRKYPVLPFLDRRCTKTYTIPGTKVVIKKGMPVYISLLGLHMCEDHFPEPEKYDPERFSQANRGKIPSFVYMPFGEGMHNCIGTRFGLVSVKVGIAALMLNFKVLPKDKIELPIKFNPKGFVIAPVDQVRLSFVSRN